MHKRLLNASFEQSTLLVNKSIITDGDKKIGDLSSMSFWKRFNAIVLPGSFFGVMLYGLGIGMPKGFLDASSDEIFVISHSAARLIGEIGVFIKPCFLFVYYLFFLLGVVNLFPNKNYAKRFLYGACYIFIFFLCTLMVWIPLVLGLTIDGTGFIGMIMQLAMGATFFMNSLQKQSHECKNVIYKNDNGDFNEKKSKNNWFKYGGILILLSMLNRYFFHIGSNISSNPGIFGVIYGWSLIVFLGFLSLVISFGYRSLLETYYFIKYSDEYYQLFKPTDEEWYGKRKARKMKKRERL